MFLSTRSVVILLILSQLTCIFLLSAAAYRPEQQYIENPDDSRAYAEEEYYRHILPNFDRFPNFEASNKRQSRRRKLSHDQRTNRTWCPIYEDQDLPSNPDNNICGLNKNENDLPFFASVGVLMQRRGELRPVLCNGAIIGRRSVLIAQSCFHEYVDDLYHKTVVVMISEDGNYDWQNWQDWFNPKRHIGYICLNPNFKVHGSGESIKYEHDFCMVSLLRPIRFSKRVRPVCLADKRLSSTDCSIEQITGKYPKTNIKISGWAEPQNCDSCAENSDEGVCVDEITERRAKGIVNCKRRAESRSETSIWYATGVHSYNCQDRSVFMDVSKEYKNIREMAHRCSKKIWTLCPKHPIEIIADCPHPPLIDPTVRPTTTIKPNTTTTATPTTSSTTSRMPSTPPSSTTTGRPDTTQEPPLSTTTTSTTTTTGKPSSGTTPKPDDPGNDDDPDDPDEPPQEDSEDSEDESSEEERAESDSGEEPSDNDE